MSTNEIDVDSSLVEVRKLLQDTTTSDEELRSFIQSTVFKETFPNIGQWIAPVSVPPAIIMPDDDSIKTTMMENLQSKEVKIEVDTSAGQEIAVMDTGQIEIVKVEKDLEIEVKKEKLEPLPMITTANIKSEMQVKKEELDPLPMIKNIKSEIQSVAVKVETPQPQPVATSSAAFLLKQEKEDQQYDRSKEEPDKNKSERSSKHKRKRIKLVPMSESSASSSSSTASQQKHNKHKKHKHTKHESSSKAKEEEKVERAFLRALKESSKSSKPKKEEPYSFYSSSRSTVKKEKTWIPPVHSDFFKIQKKYKLKMLTVPCINLLNLETFFHSPKAFGLPKCLTSVPLKKRMIISNDKAEAIEKLEKLKAVRFKKGLDRLYSKWKLSKSTDSKKNDSTLNSKYPPKKKVVATFDFLKDNWDESPRAKTKSKKKLNEDKERKDSKKESTGKTEVKLESKKFETVIDLSSDSSLGSRGNQKTAIATVKQQQPKFQPPKLPPPKLPPPKLPPPKLPPPKYIPVPVPPTKFPKPSPQPNRFHDDDWEEWDEWISPHPVYNIVPVPSPANKQESRYHLMHSASTQQTYQPRPSQQTHQPWHSQQKNQTLASQQKQQPGPSQRTQPATKAYQVPNTNMKKKAQEKRKSREPNLSPTMTKRVDKIRETIDRIERIEAAKPSVSLIIPQPSDDQPVPKVVVPSLGKGTLAWSVAQLLSKDAPIELPVMPAETQSGYEYSDYVISKIAWWILKNESEPADDELIHPELHDNDVFCHDFDSVWLPRDDDEESIGNVSDNGEAIFFEGSTKTFDDADRFDEYCGLGSVGALLRRPGSTLKAEDYTKILKVRPGTNYEKGCFEVKCYVCDEKIVGNREFGAHMRSERHKNGFRNYSLKIARYKESCTKPTPIKNFRATLMSYPSVDLGELCLKDKTAPKTSGGGSSQAIPLIHQNGVNENQPPSEASEEALPGLDEFLLSNDNVQREAKLALRIAGKWNDELEKKWTIMLEAEEKLVKRYNERREYYVEVPTRHPLHEQEWNIYWDMRCSELEAEGKDPEAYDFGPEWLRCWFTKMQEIMKAEAEKQIHDMKQELGLDSDTLKMLMYQRNTGSRGFAHRVPGSHGRGRGGGGGRSRGGHQMFRGSPRPPNNGYQNNNQSNNQGNGRFGNTNNNSRRGKKKSKGFNKQSHKFNGYK